MPMDLVARRPRGRSRALREVDAGSCNGCELEIDALNNAFYKGLLALLEAGTRLPAGRTR
jgi:hypothetical protein